MRTDMEALELKIQQLEEENLQLKGELDERPTLEDKQADEEYIDELRDLCEAQAAVLKDLCEEMACQNQQQIKVA